MFFNSAIVLAQDSPYENAQFQEVLKHDVYEPNYFTLIFGLIFVIFLIYLTGFFYQKLLGINSKINRKTNCLYEANKIKIISSMPLGQGKNVYVAEVNGKFLVLGASTNQISLLREFDQKEVDDYILNTKLMEKADEQNG